MAECSYSRCVQQKRNIRRELQRWTKTMVHIVGLERIAEELMGRRKWKLYQESMSRNYLQPLNNNVKQRITPEHPECRKDNYRSDSEQTENRRENFASEVNVKNGRTSPEFGDWKPEDKCYFCVDGKLDSEPNSQGVLSPRYSESDSSDSHSDNETPTSLTPSYKLNNNQQTQNRPTLPPNMTTIENMALAVAAFSGQLRNGGSSPGTTPPAFPIYPNMLNTHWYLANVAKSFQNERLAAAAASEADKNSGEQPLDLSKGSNSNSAGEKIQNNIRLPTLDTKHIFNSDFRAKPRMSTVAGKRNYTEDELQAALRDIQSGKLGTRRAAVIYGIPRSTLRNKVYKLALERERENHLNNSAVLKIEEDEVIDDEKELSGAEEEKEIEKTLKGPLLTFTDIMRLTDMQPEMLKTILQKNKEMEPWSSMEQSEIGAHIQNFILASQRQDGNVTNHAELFKRMMSGEHFMRKLNGDNDKRNNEISKPETARSEPDMDTESESSSSSNVILKIPSFKPTTSKNGSEMFRTIDGSIVSPPLLNESHSPPIIPNKLTIKDVKDVIAQGISQKFQQPIVEPVRRPINMEMDYKNSNFSSPLGSSVSVIKTNPQDMNRVFNQQTPSKPQQNQQNSSNQASGGKGTRPKRGKYRNYDRDSLVEAVRAVQRGEMSVHRAGSYYGVPHSTLEYKVKERHLMRPRKRDPKPNPVDEKIASLKQNDIRNAQDKLKPVVMKPPQKFPPTSPNGMKIPFLESNMSPLPGYNAPPFPFWTPPGFSHIALDYARNPSTSFPTTPEFFASQMMQKLQEETSRSLSSGSQNSTPSSTPTLAKSARQMAESLLDGTGSNGSFLDGIIRSSLESGVPNNDNERLMKEENNVTPENMSNKALLDQLCRNSRLTPLSKPSGDASSGDESYRKGNSSPLNFTASSIKEEKMDDSPPPSEMIESTNDSCEKNQEAQPKLPGRIYLKQDLVNPDNLKPEMLVRFIPDVDRNGICENPGDSASENEAQQD